MEMQNLAERDGREIASGTPRFERNKEGVRKESRARGGPRPSYMCAWKVLGHSSLSREGAAG